MMRKLGTIVVLCSMAIAMPVFCSIAEDPKEVEQWFHDLTTKADQKVTKLHFYFQDWRGTTTTTVAQSNTSLTSPTFFGLTYMADDPLTVGPSQASKVVGRAQGLYGSSSKEDISVFMAMDIVFTDGTYNGSTLTVLGSNPVTQTRRELPVIGGTGVFRLARGVALLNTYFFNASTQGVDSKYNGWCARSGQGVNPYMPSGSPCGSSSGSAISVAANMVAVSLGTETHSSIICPSDHNSVVGLKPTIGLTSPAGVIPCAPRWDTIGTVEDAVYVLDVIAGFDPRDDEATREGSKFIPEGGYKQFLKNEGLKGKRLGVVRSPFVDTLHDSAIAASFEDHLSTLRKRGAIVVDNLHIANIDEILDPHRSGELMVMATDFKISINAYLKELITSPVRSLTDVITFNQNNPELEKLAEYGQQTFIEAEESTGIGEKEIQVLENLEKLSKEGFEKLMKENDLDALVTPGSRASPILAIGGYPAITVPAGYDSDGMPFGICFGGLRGTEPKLVEIAYGFEQATKVRRPPRFSMSSEKASV